MISLPTMAAAIEPFSFPLKDAILPQRGLNAALEKGGKPRRNM